MQVVALWMLAGLVAAVGCLIVLQLLARLSHLEAGDDPTLDALGMTSVQRFSFAMVRAAFIGVIGAVVAVVIALAVSAVFPTGLAGVVEPNPGVAVDSQVLFVGAFTTVLLVPLLAAGPAWRSARAERHIRADQPRRSRLAGLGPRVASSPSVAVGAASALHRGRGRTAVPVGTSLAAVTLGVGVAVAALTVSASLGHLLGTPQLYGVTWDMAVWNGGGEFPAATELAPIAEQQDGVVAMSSGGQATTLEIAGQAVELVGFDVRVGDAAPPVVEGRRPSEPGEVALGTTTMRRLDVEVGDRIEATNADGGAERLHVVGRAVLPSQGEDLQLGEGGYATVATVLRLDGEDQDEAGSGALYLALEDGVDQEALFDELRAPFCAGDQALVCEVFPLPLEKPTDIVNFGRVESTPLILGGLLGLLAAGTLMHVLVSVVRRRRADLAMLRILGFTRRQLRATIAVSGLDVRCRCVGDRHPLGVAVGSVLWGSGRKISASSASLASHGSASPSSSRSRWACRTPSPLLPGRAAARTRPAAVLRSE